VVVTAPSLGVLVAHSAGPVLRSQEGSGEEGLLRYARGIVVIASKACSGPIPLRYASIRGVSQNKNGGPALVGRTAVPKTAQEFLSQP
jgi:hypothetical protein